MLGVFGAGRTGSGGNASEIRPWVAITVPVLSLLEHDDEPATMEGYGPIDIETARRLTVNAPSLTRILTHPETGAVLSVGRTRYKVPADLRMSLRVQDETCRKVGCNRAAARCDIDHTLPWAHGGQTSRDNLAHLCPAHHAEKHNTDWRMKHLANGDIEWTSPGGHSYISEPAVRMPPVPYPLRL